MDTFTTCLPVDECVDLSLVDVLVGSQDVALDGVGDGPGGRERQPLATVSVWVERFVACRGRGVRNANHFCRLV